MEGGALGDAAVGDGALDAGAGAVGAGVDADPVDPAVDPAVVDARDGSSVAALVAEEDCPDAWPSAVNAEPSA